MIEEINKKEAEGLFNTLLQIIDKYFLKQKLIEWKIHLKSSPSKVYEFLDTESGRSKFWAESAEERDGVIHFKFPSGYKWSGKVLGREQDKFFSLNYIDNSKVSFYLHETENGETDLSVKDENFNPKYYSEIKAGWISVLMSMKAAVDHGVDLRNHDPKRNWDQRFADN